MPKQQLSCDHKMIGLGVSHSFMAAINPFFHLPVMFLFLQAQDQMKCNISEAKFKFIIFVVIVGTLFLESCRWFWELHCARGGAGKIVL